MTSERHLIRAGWDAGPGLMQRPGEAGGSRGAGSRTERWEQPRQRDGRAVLPDARARASETERQSESEPVVEAPSFADRPETWRTWAGCSNDRALEDGRSLRPRKDGRQMAGETLRLLPGCAAGVEPTADPVKRITVNVGSAPERAGPLVAARQGPMPADAAGAWRSPRSSPRRGKPVHMAKADSRTAA